jgi:hypothetical protein
MEEVEGSNLSRSTKLNPGKTKTSGDVLVFTPPDARVVDTQNERRPRESAGSCVLQANSHQIGAAHAVELQRHWERDGFALADSLRDRIAGGLSQFYESPAIGAHQREIEPIRLHGLGLETAAYARWLCSCLLEQP